MTGFDETVPTELDPDQDATSAEDIGDNVVPPSGGPVPDDAGNDLDEIKPEYDSKDPAVEDDLEPHEPNGKPMAGDADLISGSTARPRMTATMPEPDVEDTARRRRETSEERAAAAGDGLAEATRGVQSGLGISEKDDTADGEDANNDDGP